jgi:hypothetical protein
MKGMPAHPPRYHLIPVDLGYYHLLPRNTSSRILARTGNRPFSFLAFILYPWAAPDSSRSPKTVVPIAPDSCRLPVPAAAAIGTYRHLPAAIGTKIEVLRAVGRACPKPPHTPPLSRSNTSYYHQIAANHSYYRVIPLPAFCHELVFSAKPPPAF